MQISYDQSGQIVDGRVGHSRVHVAAFNSENNRNR